MEASQVDDLIAALRKELKEEKQRGEILSIKLYEAYTEFEHRLEEEAKASKQAHEKILSQELNAMESRCENQIQTLKQEFEKEHQNTLSKQSEMQTLLANTETMNVDLEQKAKQLEHELEETREMLGRRDAAAEILLKTADDAHAEAKELRQERDELRSELGKEISTLRAKLTEAEEHLSETQRLLMDRNVAGESLQRKLDSTTKDTEKLRNEVMNVRSEMGSMLAKARSEAAATLQEERSEHEQMVTELRLLLEQREAAAELLQRQLDDSIKVAKDARLETANVRTEMGKARMTAAAECEAKIAEIEKICVQETNELRGMLKQRDEAAEISQRLLDQSIKEAKDGREAVMKVRSDMGELIENARAEGGAKLAEKEQESNELRSLLKRRDEAAEISQRLLDESTKEAKEAREAIMKVRSDMGELIEKARAEGEQKLAAKEQESNELRSLLKRRDEAAEISQRLLDESTKEAKEAREAVTAVRSTMGELIESARSERDQKIAEKGKEADELRKLLGERNRAAESLQRSLDESREEVKTVRKQIETLRTELGVELAKVRAKAEEANEALAKLSEEKKTLETTLKTEKERLKEEVEKAAEYMQLYATAEKTSVALNTHYRRFLLGLMAVTPLFHILESTMGNSRL